MIEEKETNSVERMKKEHDKSINECERKAREKWSEDGDQQKTATDPDNLRGATLSLSV